MPIQEGPAPPVGAYPTTIENGGPFPDPPSVCMPVAMSHQQIINLISWYNDDMGIVSDDDLLARQFKVSAWLQ